MADSSASLISSSSNGRGGICQSLLHSTVTLFSLAYFSEASRACLYMLANLSAYSERWSMEMVQEPGTAVTIQG